ncbi:ABC transporter ATP-binding protein [Enterococcus faecalis]|uniref:ABC transporter ATP-binding protein n=1 Tax=Enterococcus faecalis TaxID=1351 RepID=UPI000664E6E8|nr:ABC transporter ATP-binding protein [Enterococcus faecalis]
MIKIEHLEKRYEGKQIYTDLNIQLEKNHSYALVGPSGSGKTTLLNAIGRLEKPTEGKIYFEGKDIWKMKESKYFGQYLGYVFQNYALMDEATVYENLKIIDNRLSIIKALKKVGLDESYLKMKIYELSGGQAQRVAIARVLLKKAQIILADEPTGALDEVTGQSIIQLLLELVSPNTIVIFATHDPRVFEKVDHVIDVSKL